MFWVDTDTGDERVCREYGIALTVAKNHVRRTLGEATITALDGEKLKVSLLGCHEGECGTDHVGVTLLQKSPVTAY